MFNNKVTMAHAVLPEATSNLGNTVISASAHRHSVMCHFLESSTVPIMDSIRNISFILYFVDSSRRRENVESSGTHKMSTYRSRIAENIKLYLRSSNKLPK
ncbi:hypothetical protein BDV95DRAFT_147640 [Massariosphaeria phaeospora]|uniref:Uncharacterized protein n=1 Tax=Massariosphaeria phaeospora TaxID=100035 RepID=A0A7C8IIS9_9PLEO|nr:hypothetical protein BDV95DRAFT_147640 [Massariosphaeria phaeospora]